MNNLLGVMCYVGCTVVDWWMW